MSKGEEEKGGERRYSPSLIIIEAGNGGSAQGPSDRSETSMLFWVILSHNRGGGVKGVIYVINLVWWVSYMVLNGIDLVIYRAGQ